MPTTDLTQAFLVGRNAYLIDQLAFRGILDQATNQFRLQVAVVGSQVWVDWLTVDATGHVTIAALAGTPFPINVFLGGQLAGLLADTVYTANIPEGYQRTVDFDGIGTCRLEVNVQCQVSLAVTCSVKAQYWDPPTTTWIDLTGSEVAVVLGTAFTVGYGLSGLITKPTGQRLVRLLVKGSTGAANPVAAVGFLVGAL